MIGNALRGQHKLPRLNPIQCPKLYPIAGIGNTTWTKRLIILFHFWHCKKFWHGKNSKGCFGIKKNWLITKLIQIYDLVWASKRAPSCIYFFFDLPSCIYSYTDLYNHDRVPSYAYHTPTLLHNFTPPLILRYVLISK